MKKLMVMVILLGMAGMLRADPVTRYWRGTGNASVDANWEDEEENPGAPQTGDIVVFDASSGSCTWNLNVALGGWTQTVDYVGTVTIQTKFPDQGGFTNLVINGDVTLNGGTWTHGLNTGATAENRLTVTIGGDFTLGAAATVHANERGFRQGHGLGAGSGTTSNDPQDRNAASYGGQGAYRGDKGWGPAPTYGSFREPIDLGSGVTNRNEYAGGAVMLDITGDAIVDGVISANGHSGTRNNLPSGGSVLLRAASLAGGGTLEALGGGATGTNPQRNQGGGGGRIAVLLSGAPDFGEVTYDASGVHHGSTANGGMAGTVYLEGIVESVPQGQLIVDNKNKEYAYTSERGPLFTVLPPEVPELSSVWEGVVDAELVVTNRGQVVLNKSIYMRDFTWLDANSILDLNGHTLYVAAEEPEGDFPEDYGNGEIIYNDGRIIWDAAPEDLAVKLNVAFDDTRGAVQFDPDESGADYWYLLDTEVTLTAVPEAGYTHRWGGDIGTENPLDATITVTMTDDMDISVVFVPADSSTWVGLGADNNASTADNWFPEAPSGGRPIIIENAHAFLKGHADITWDAGMKDVAIQDWTQTADYNGLVTIQTVYPDAGLGDFTNLTINGNLTLNGGTWTHVDNNASGQQTLNQNRWLAVTVGGNFAMGENALIDLGDKFVRYSGRGYGGSGGATSSGPGAGSGATDTYWGASHGGRGGRGEDGLGEPSPTYGSFTAPTTLGSGGWLAGGGAFFITVEGASLIDGIIQADGGGDSGARGGAAGGSVFIKSAGVAGSGNITARGTVSDTRNQPGGGGRIAVVVSDGAGFDEITFDASGGYLNVNLHGSAGTVYLEGRDNGTPVARLLIDNATAAYDPGLAWTPLPADLAAPGCPAICEEGYYATLTLTNRAQVVLNTDMRMWSLDWVDTNAILDLDGNTLYMRSQAPNGFPAVDEGEDDEIILPAAFGGGKIIRNGGEIRWTSRGTLILLR